MMVVRILLSIVVVSFSGSLVLAGTPETDCFDHVTKFSLGTDDQAAQVCQNAQSNAPALCFNNAVKIHWISPETAVRLCKYATSTQPADCYRESTQVRNLSENSAVNLCRRNPCLDCY